MRRFEGSGKSGRRDSNRSEHSGPSRFNRRDSESDDSGPRRFSRRDSSDSDNGGSRRFGGRDSGRKSFEMHKVTCDKCGQSITKGELIEVPFLYLDKNDKHHPDLGGGRRQYAVCASCWHKGV